jgi:hypothetical protein
MLFTKSIRDHFYSVCGSFVRGSTEILAKGKGIITPTNEGEDILAQRFGSGAFARPYEGTGGVAMGTGIDQFGAEASVNEPSAVGLAIGKVVIDDLEASWEEEGKTAKDCTCALVKRTCVEDENKGNNETAD